MEWINGAGEQTCEQGEARGSEKLRKVKSRRLMPFSLVISSGKSFSFSSPWFVINGGLLDAHVEAIVDW